jgi:hypothetical protein
MGQLYFQRVATERSGESESRENFKTGLFTVEQLAERRTARELIRQVRKMLGSATRRRGLAMRTSANAISYGMASDSARVAALPVLEFGA